LAGLAALLLAALALGVAACDNPTGSGNDNDGKELSGGISINPNSGVTTGAPLTAVYSGSESVSYRWNKDGTAIAGAAGPAYTPAEAGRYTVTVSCFYHSRCMAQGLYCFRLPPDRPE
jgi:hypothetical protein